MCSQLVMCPIHSGQQGASCNELAHMPELLMYAQDAHPAASASNALTSVCDFARCLGCNSAGFFDHLKTNVFMITLMQDT